MNFLDFIFDNIFIIAIVVFGLINLFSRSAKSNQSEQRKQQTRPTSNETQKQETSPSSRPQGPILGRMAEKVESAFEEISNEYERKHPSEKVEDQQRKQYEQLKKEVQHEYASNTNEADHKALKRSNKLRTTTDDASYEMGDIGIKSLTNRKGIVQGMIMSEVLGPPRGLKPYRSVINKRRT